MTFPPVFVPGLSPHFVPTLADRKPGLLGFFGPRGDGEPWGRPLGVVPVSGSDRVSGRGALKGRGIFCPNIWLEFGETYSIVFSILL